MRQLILTVALVSIGATLVGARQAAPARGRGAAAPAAQAPPPAPPAGSPATYKSDAELTTALKAAIARATPGAQVSAPFATTDQYSINLVHRTVGATPLTHTGNTELHHIVEGSATIVTGGKIVRGPNGATIEGGVTRHVTKGDVILVPAETPHWYQTVDGSVTYLEVRFVVPTK